MCDVVKDCGVDPMWLKLQAFEVGSSDCEFAFTQRLARENGWGIAFSERCILEYKKFIYLIATQQQVCTPA